MIVVMEPSATQEQLDAAVKKVGELGLRANVIVGAERTVIAVVGEERQHAKEALEGCAGVASVMPILAPYKMASRELRSEPTVIRSRGFAAGARHIGVIAGPCSVETEEQIVATARAVKQAGANALRGGAFKPRTSPYSFQGLKETGLKMLTAAREETGLAIVTEVVASEDVDLVARYSDILQIGAAEAWPLGDDGRVPVGRGIHPQRRQPRRDAVRTRDPHLRNPHPFHAPAGKRPVPAPQVAPAGDHRS
jgi:3-deoxy-7-phosphoheptulonate synthase